MTYFTGYNDYNEQEAYAYEQEAAWQADCDIWDELMPDWQDREVDPEESRYVPVNDVAYAEEYVLRGDWSLIPGAYGDGAF